VNSAKYKTYTVTIEVNVRVKHDGLVVQQPESVASAVRHAMITLIPSGFRKNGIMFETATFHAEAVDKEVAA